MRWIVVFSVLTGLVAGARPLRADLKAAMESDANSLTAIASAATHSTMPEPDVKAYAG